MSWAARASSPQKDRLLSFEDAAYADGLAVAHWLEHRKVDVACLTVSQRRNLFRWRTGGQASFYTIDEVLTRVGLHVSELPDHVWISYDNGRSQRAA